MINNMKCPKFKVCIRCMTYNQAKYIVDTMNGFAIQQTDFPFVCCIVDDASTDGEQQVIKEYLIKYFELADSSVSFSQTTDYASIIFAQHKENKNCYFAVLFLNENLYSKHMGYKKLEYISIWRDNCKYEAICEGDDYWIDLLKLHKQVDILDNNSQIGLVYTSAKQYNEKTKTYSSSIIGKRLFTKQDLYISNEVPTLTTMYRKDLLDLYFKEINIPNLLMGDYPMWLYFNEKSQLYFLDETTSVYRVLANSASHSKSVQKTFNFEECAFRIRKYFIDKYHRENITPLIDKEYVKRILYFGALYQEGVSYPISYLKEKGFLRGKYVYMYVKYILNYLRYAFIK